MGILLGVMFGLFNASFVWGTRVIFERMEPAKPKVENSTENSSVSKGKGILQKLDAVVDATKSATQSILEAAESIGSNADKMQLHAAGPVETLAPPRPRWPRSAGCCSCRCWWGCAGR